MSHSWHVTIHLFDADDVDPWAPGSSANPSTEQLAAIREHAQQD